MWPKIWTQSLFILPNKLMLYLSSKLLIKLWILLLSLLNSLYISSLLEVWFVSRRVYNTFIPLNRYKRFINPVKCSHGKREREICLFVCLFVCLFGVKIKVKTAKSIVRPNFLLGWLSDENKYLEKETISDENLRNFSNNVRRK